MKIKDLERTANIAWSPADHYPVLLAAGTAAQQLDASFNTSAALEVYSLNLNEPGMDMELKANVASEQRFHKIVWAPHNIGNECGKGIIVGGCDGGVIQIYNVQKLLRNENGLISKQDKHSGPVNALDFNPFQSNLLATGANESEIFIWDMNKISTPMTPGAKSQPSETVLSVAWNRQVQHILASTFTTKCVVWDLRKNEPIIKLSDTTSRIRWKVVAWHPEVATQLCLASEDDQAPVIQLWDLRFATSPLKIMDHHQRGILSLAWCIHDPDLLISCAKDNRIVCCNPNTNERDEDVLSEIARTNQWSFDVAWCKRNPAIIASPSFDGHVSIYSLMGGKVQQIQTSNKIADSFPGMDGYIEAPLPQQATTPVSVDLKKAPKWLKRPVGAVFGFGGKLITFQRSDKNAPAQTQQNRLVNIHQVVTEEELVRKSFELEQALEQGNFKEYCMNKADSIGDQHRKYIWHFLKAQFEENPRLELLNLLGYRIDDVNAKLKQYTNDVDEISEQFINLNKNHSDYGFDHSAPVSQTDDKKTTKKFAINTGNDTEGLIAQALILGNVEAAVELCFKAKRYADAIIIAMTGGSDLLAKTQFRYLQQSEGYLTSLISALVSEDWASVINNCDINSWKEALAAALTHSSDEDLPLLCEQMGVRLEREGRGNSKLEQDAQLCYICAGSFEKLVDVWSGEAKHSTRKLQELVELVTFLRSAIERQGRHVEISGSLAELLTYYASILASQGSLQTALNYLGSSQDEKVTSLRERLFVCLGLRSTQNQAQQQSARTSNNLRQSFSSYFGQPTQAIPNSNNFNTGLPNQPLWQPQPAASFVAPPKTSSPAPVVPPSRPPRPTSVGSNHGGSCLTTRNKYVVDPSVQSNQYGARNNFATNPLLPPQQQHLQPSQTMQPNFQASASSITNPYSAPFVPNTAASFNQNNQNTLTQPPVEIGQSAMNYLPTNTAPGWNDPPVLNKPLKPQNKQEIALQEPIMHPLYGTVAPQDNGYATHNLQNNQFQAAPPPLQPTGPQFGQQFNVQAVTQQGYNFVTPSSPQMIPQKETKETIERKIESVQKLPIPEEHIHMQTVFEELRTRCSCAANNPQTKRKLEDVSRKLEALYDLLREQKLSQNTLTMLHQMVQSIQNGDYTGGLALHTQLVSGPDFAQIASFMPGLKVLLQCALQLQVFLR